MAECEDFNEGIGLCAGCGEKSQNWGSDSISWRYEHSIEGPFTTIWICVDCQSLPRDRCLDCEAALDSEEDAPLCADCLATYEDSIAELVAAGSCRRCGTQIPRGEWDQFSSNGQCGWCAHREYKMYADDGESGRWSPESCPGGRRQ